MRIKTFYANSMTQALQRIREELGPEALILSTKEIRRKSGLGFGNQWGFEVVAALDSHDPLAAGGQGGSAGGVAGATPAVDPASDLEPDGTYSQRRLAQGRYVAQRSLKVDPDYLEKRRLRHSLTRPAPPPVSIFNDAVAYELYQDLVANEVSEWLAYKLIDEGQQMLSASNRGSRSKLFRAMIVVARDLIRAASDPTGVPAKRVLAVVGPTGAGKTTAIAKLAARLALENRKKVVLVTLDSYRIAGADQLRTYAGLIGVPFRVVQQVSELPAALRDYAQRDFILLDTTGRGPRDMGEMQELLEFMRNSDQIEPHLVVSATTKAVDMQEVVDRFSVCNPSHLLFTKLDETSTFGPIFNELVRTQKPPSYFTDGQRVPEDLHCMPKDRIVDILLNAN